MVPAPVRSPLCQPFSIGPDGERDRRNVDRCRGHQAGRGGLVAADGQDDAVDRIAIEQFDETEIGKVSVERRRRAFTGFLDRMDRKLEGKAAGFPDAFAHALGEFQVMAVAGGQVRPGLGDADDRLAGLQLLAGDAEIQVALDIERRHAGVVRIVEPGGGPQFRYLPVAHDGASPLNAFWVVESR
jgi:hypothetical protein